MFGISFEHLIILGVVLLIFGPRRLPELGHTMGKAIRNFKEAISGVEEAQFRKLDSSGSPTEAKKNPEAITQKVDLAQGPQASPLQENQKSSQSVS